MLRIENLTKTFGSKKAVDNLSLHIERGQIYGFIGHNGAGKTTTLKSIAGIMEFDQGDIYIDGKSIKEDPLACKAIMAYIPDNPDLYEYLTGIKYLNFISDVYGISQEDRKMKIKKYGDMFELSDSLKEPISAYSHGMKQKLAIIMDEPFVGLDPKASHLLKGLMKEICNQGGAIFFSTHVLEVAEKLCNKIAIIKAGKLVISGNTQEVIGNESLEDVFLELEDENA